MAEFQIHIGVIPMRRVFTSGARDPAWSTVIPREILRYTWEAASLRVTPTGKLLRTTSV